MNTPKLILAECRNWFEDVQTYSRTTHPTPNSLLFYLYDDGSVEKRIQLER